MRHVIKTLIVPFLISSSSLAASKTVDVVIEGAPPGRVDFYRNRVQPILKNRVDMESIEESLDALYETNTLSTAEAYIDEITNERTTLTFKIFPKQILRGIKVIGFKKISKSEILSEFGLNEGEAYSEDKIKLGLENIKKLYNLNGYLLAQVGAHFDQPDSATVNLIIDIEEGAACLIEAFVFTSPNMKLNKELQNSFSKSILTPLSQSNLNEIQSKITEYLTKNKFFSSTLISQDPKINADKSRAVLTFNITDPYSYELIFEGNQQFTDYQILKELKLDENNRLSSSPVDDLKERLLKFYRSKGYATVTLKHRENIYSDDYVRRINFTINEGAKVRIKSIQMEGTFSRPNDYYAEFLLSHSGELADKNYYSAEELESGVKNLVSELQNQGFISAQVVSTRADYDKSKENVTIKLNLSEGPQTFIDKIVFKGNSKIAQSVLEQVIGLKTGGPLQLAALAEAGAKIADYYKSLGYLEARTSDQPKDLITYFNDNKKAVLTFDIYEGPQITVDSIVIEGNTFTKDYVIMRELQFKQGDILTPEKINYSEVRLQRLALFNSIEIRTLTDDPNQGRRTVLIVVTERNPGIFKSGIGADNELTLSLRSYAGAAYRNLLGTGRSINARVEVDDKITPSWSFWEKEITAGYTEPFIFDTDNNVRFSGTYSSKLYSISSTSSVPSGQVVYALDTLQASALLERDINRYFKLIYDIYGFEKANTYEIFAQMPLIPIDIRTTGPTFIYDRRDNVFNPRQGYIASASVEYAAPEMGSSSSVNYIKSVADASAYIPLGKLVFAQQVKAGYIWNLYSNSGSVIPQIKAFVLGGRSTIRGYDVTETIPRLTDIPNGIIANGSPASYELFYLSKSELRFPIIGNFGGAIFYDGGQIEIPNYSQVYNWRDSVGLGLRYNTPVGPVSVEYGLKRLRDQSRGETPGTFYFSIGVF